MSIFISISAPRFNRYVMLATRAGNPNVRFVVLRCAFRIVFRIGKLASATLARLLNLFLRLSAGLDYSHRLFLKVLDNLTGILHHISGFFFRVDEIRVVRKFYSNIFCEVGSVCVPMGFILNGFHRIAVSLQHIA